MQTAVRVLQILLLILYPIAVHASVYLHQPNIALIPLLLLMVSHIQPKKIFISPLKHGLILFVLAGLIVSSQVYDLSVLLYLPPIMINLMLLIIFAKTLLPDQEPLITKLARVVYHDNQPEVQKYTRHVTKIWCLFFVAMLMETILLSLFADERTWSLFSNFLNYVFIAMLFSVEYIYRKIKFKNTDPLLLTIKKMINTDMRLVMRPEQAVSIPLIAHQNQNDIVAFRDDMKITRSAFLRHVYIVASQVPEQLYIINLCEDRYYFTVLFAAALLQKKITLLPHNKTSHVIAELQQEFHDHIILGDSEVQCYLQNDEQNASHDSAIPDI
jgi:uncharacterized membrane protein